MKRFQILPPSGHFRRQLLAMRAFLIFFAAWFLLERFLTSPKHMTLLLAACFAGASLITRSASPSMSIWTARVVWALGPPCSLLIVEVLNNTDPFEALSVTQCALNLVWYFLFFGLLMLIFGRIRLSAGLACALCFAAGLANHYVLRFRGRVIFPGDLAGFGTALNVAGGFDYAPDAFTLRAALFAIAYLLMVLRLPRQRAARRPRAQVTLPLIAAGAVYCAAFFGTGMLTALDIYAQQWKTQANGFVLNFTAALRYSLVSAPAGYSPAAAKKITDAVPTPSPSDGQRPVHIIAVMNESFSDFSAYDQLRLSEDPAPFLHSMQENTIKGSMYSPVTGGGTANVEFEFLTGNPLAFLPPSTVAYQLYLRENTPSLVSQLDALGYASAAFHPYKSSGWNRTSVYDWMGFDTQLYEEDVPNATRVRGFISDQSNYEKIFELTDQAGDQPLFVFNVTMQNHSGYTLPWTGLERTSQLAGELAGSSAAADQFFSLIRASDDALANMISHYQQSDVPTMIIFFGDHQPPLSNEFYEDLAGKPLDSRTTEEVLQQYQTPFFIWANYDIPEAEDVQLSSWALGLLTAQTANLPLTGYQQFLSRLTAQLPVVTPVGIRTSDGSYSSEQEESLTPAQRTLLEQYRILMHNNLFGKQERIDRFFFPAD